MLNFSRYREQLILWWNLPPKFMNSKCFEKLHIKLTEIWYKGRWLNADYTFGEHEIWGANLAKIMSDKNLEKNL